MSALLSSLKVFCLIVLLFSQGVHSVEVENLYTGKILVTDKSQKTRVKAHRWAIEQVLTKVTGSRDILDNKTVQYEVRVKTANYIKSFTFISDEQGRTFLVDQFDQSKVDALVRKVGESIWGQRRPKAALWIAIQEGLSRTIVSNEGFPQIGEVLTQSAENRGLPIALPKMDEVDKESVFASDVWARFDGVVKQASERYNSEYFVMARLRSVDSFKEPEYKSGWVLEFVLFKGRQFMYKETFNGEQFWVLKQLIDSVGDFFASQYSVNNEQIQQQNISFKINNLKSIVDLKSVENYLIELPAIKKVSLDTINADTAEFTLWLSGQALDVIKSLSLLPSFKKLESTYSAAERELTVEERLQVLTDEYTKQNDLSSNEKPLVPQITSLTYQWVDL